MIDLVNRLFEGDGVFAGFRTHEAFDRRKPGCIEVLPMIGKSDPKVRASAGTDDALRDPLDGPRAEEEDLRVVQEAAQLVEGLLHGAQFRGVQAGPGQFPADHRRAGVAGTTLLEVDLLEDAVQGIPRPGAAGKAAQGAIGTPASGPWGAAVPVMNWEERPPDGPGAAAGRIYAAFLDVGFGVAMQSLLGRKVLGMARNIVQLCPSKNVK